MATYYWVGGAGTWDAVTTTNWSTTSGGPGGAGVPTSADDVEFDGSSGALGEVVTVVNGAVAKKLSYVIKRMEFSGAGATLVLHGSIYVVVTPPSGIIDIDDIFMLVKTATGTSISSPAPFKNLSLRNSVSPTAKATLSLASILYCKNIFNQDVSITSVAPFMSVNCTQFRLENYGTGTGRTIGTLGNDFFINITPEAAGTAFSCVWDDALAAFYGVTVTISNATGNQSVSSSLQASYATSFNLTVNNSNVTFAQLNGGINSLVLLNGASFRIASITSTPIFKDLTVNSGCTIDSSSSSNYLSLQKKAMTPDITRNIQNISGGTWKTLGIRSSILINTDVINISGNIGTLANPIGDFYTGPALIGAGTVYASFVSVSNNTSFSGTVLDAGLSFEIFSGITVTGTYTVNTVSASLEPNGQLIPNLNISGDGLFSQATLSSNLLVTNLSITTVLGGGGGGLLVRNGSSISVAGTLTLAGASASDIVDFRAYDLYGTPPVLWTVVKASGTVDASFARIAYSGASGGATFDAYQTNGCINGGNNTGWNFSQPSGFFLFL